jgi:glycosyltransferase involved in cell wall biosynthesis
MSGELTVSVITPAYNAAEFIDRCLDSIDIQTFPPSELEHIVVDDGSSDHTAEVVNENGDSHVRLLETEHSGPTTSLNYGIEHARGQFIVILDSDDEFEPTLIERMSEKLITNPDIDFVYSDYWENPVNGGEFRVSTENNLLNLITVGVMHRRQVLVELGCFDPKMHFPEYDLLLRYRKHQKRGQHIDMPLFTYHRRADSQTGTADWLKEGEKQLQQKFGEDVEIRDY